MKLSHQFWIVTALLGLSSSTVEAAPADGTKEYIVRLKESADEYSFATHAEILGVGSSHPMWSSDSPHTATAVLTRPSTLTSRRFKTYEIADEFKAYSTQLTASQAKDLAMRPDVLSVSPVVPMRKAVIVDTQLLGQSGLWGLDRVDARKGLDKKYIYDATGEGVDCYVIDTGIQTKHVEFAGRLEPGYSAVEGEGVEDKDGHGTHVAGIMAGETYGVAKGCTVIPVKVFPDNGDESDDSVIIAGIDWSVKNAKRRRRRAVINMSLGGEKSKILNAAVRAAVRAGIPVVVAAGNEQDDSCNYSPSDEPSAITVGATTSTDGRFKDSNYGTCVDIFAPGKDIKSAYHKNVKSGTVLSGTSYATPYVAGVVALHLSKGVPASRVKNVLSQRATKDVIKNAGEGSPNLLLFSRTEDDEVNELTLPGRNKVRSNRSTNSGVAPMDIDDSVDRMEQ
ncbi:peptidase S8/S53 domain-containing protein [Paraphysoderma sedebokerense]|nr:peptidase S8/S53 domain-containing protein [Paraphysoderma sedebokerense]